MCTEPLGEDQVHHCSLKPDSVYTALQYSPTIDIAIDAQCPKMLAPPAKIKQIWTLSDMLLFPEDFHLLVLGATDEDDALFP